MRHNNSNDLTKYIRKNFATEDELLKSIRQQCLELNRPINIDPEEGQLLSVLIKMKNIKNILEIGTFLGYSTIWQARALDENGTIHTVEQDLESFEMAKKNFKLSNVNNKIKQYLGRIQDIEDEFNNEIFDMIFIDANKNLYLEFLDIAERHITTGSIIVADNTLLSGAVYSEQLPDRVKQSTKNAMVEFNRRLADRQKYTSILLPSNDGFLIAVRN